MPLVIYFLQFAVTLLLALHAQSLSAKPLDGDQLLAPDHLLEIRIELPQADWDSLRTQARNPGAFFAGTAEENPYTYFKGDIWIDGTKIESVGIRKKGFFGSQDNNRPSLKVKFDEYVKQNPVQGLDRLTLNNNKQDRSQLSQFLAYKLFRDAGIHAPRSNLARVTVNGQNLGVYSNVECIKKPFLTRSFGDKSGNLYEGTLTDFHPKTIDKLEIKTNEKSNDAADVRRLADRLAADGPLQLTEIAELIDVDAFIRYWAIEGMIRFWDGYASNQNNFYFYVSPKTGLGYFIPWGADFAFTTGGPFASFNNQGNTAIYAQSILANRLYKTAGMPDRYRQTMLSLLDNVWKEDQLLAEIDRIEKLVAAHLHESQRDTPQATEELRAFVRSRRQELESALQDWPANVPSVPRKPMYTVEVGEVSGAFETNFSETPPQDPASDGQAKLQVTLDGNVIEFERTGVTAFTFQLPRFDRPGFNGPGRAPPGNFEPPVSLNFTGIRGNGEPMTLALFVAPAAFRTKQNAPIDVSGQLTVGPQRGFGFGPSGRRLNGKLYLSKSGTTAGDQIEGTFELRVVETHGGFFNQPQSPRGPAPVPDAERRPPRPGPLRPRPPLRSLLQTFDENGDGKLSTQEIEAAAEVLRRLDRNGDGELTTTELSGSVPELQPRNRPSGR